MQFCFRSDDPEILAAVEHEMVRHKCTRSASLLALVLDGLAYRRRLREADALHVYSAKSGDADLHHRADEKEHDG